MAIGTVTRSQQLRSIYDQPNAILDPDEAVLFPILDHLGDLIGQSERDEARRALSDA